MSIRILNEIKRKRLLAYRYNRVDDIVSKVTKIPKLVFTSETLIKDLNNSDEMDILQIILECEIEFNIEIPDELFTSFKTIGDLYKHFGKINVKK